MTTPQDFGLPTNHTEFREHQLESIHFCLDAEGFATLEAPTGSGKTCLPAAVSSRHSVISLVRTKALQLGNYDHLYDFDAHYGKSNYKCINPDVASGVTADLCPFESKMHKCPQSSECPYLISKTKAWHSSRASLNYSYWLTARNWREKNAPQVLFCDECHNLPQVVIDFVSCTLGQKDIVEWSLPSPPFIQHRHANVLLRLPPPAEIAIPWLQQARDVMADHYRQLRRSAKVSEKARERLRKAENIGRKVRGCLDALRQNYDDWYIRSGPTALQFGRETRPGFTARPLTAAYDFKRFFLNGHCTIAMSATIGDPDQFATELGIADYAFRSVPSRFSPERRTVHVLDCPAMSAKATDADFEHQADAIAKFVKRYPPHWSGLIHVSRIKEEKLLHDRLCRRGLSDRVFYIHSKQESYTPTDKQLKAWQRRKRRVPNSLLVTCSFGEGYDGLDEQVNISAKIPYRRYGSEESYDRAWATYSRKRYAQDAGVSLMQQLGRTRRGREEDYDTADEVRGANAVADGSLGRVKNYLSESFKEALIV